MLRLGASGFPCSAHRQRFVDRTHTVSGAPKITLGIDLGNSFSTAAAWVNGRCYFVPDTRGEPCIPSVVYFPAEGTPAVGAYAQRMRQAEPAHTISGIKRILGRKFDSTEVKILAAHSAICIRKAANGTPILVARDREYTPIEIAAIIIEHLKERAQERFCTRIDKCVLTLPASATTDVEHATVQAARAAGFEVLRTVTEPHAAALAAGLARRNAQRRVLVYDFGGGTFDATALDQDDGKFKPLAVGGDGCLGGDDLDHALADLASAHVWKTTKVDLSKDLERWERLVREAENTKRALSVRHVAPLRLKHAYSVRGVDRDIELMIHRNDLEARWTPLVQRSATVAAQTLLAAELKPRDVGTTLMVGGTTYVPMVKTALDRLMGPTIVHHDRPQTAVAEGAAIAAARAMARTAA